MSKDERTAILSFFIAGIVFDIITGFSWSWVQYIFMPIIAVFCGFGAADCIERTPKWMKNRRYN